MSNATSENMSTLEQGIRFVVGGSMIVAVLTNPAVSPLLALAACYPVFTGIMRWEPVYALFRHLAAQPAAAPIYAPVQNPFAR